MYKSRVPAVTWLLMRLAPPANLMNGQARSIY